MICFGIQHFMPWASLNVAGGDFAFFVHAERELARLVIVGFELHLLQVENDVGHVLDHAGQSGELVLGAGNFDRGDGGAFERAKAARGGVSCRRCGRNRLQTVRRRTWRKSRWMWLSSLVRVFGISKRP